MDTNIKAKRCLKIKRSRIEKRKITINGRKAGDVEALNEQLYFKCVDCSRFRKFSLEDTAETIIISVPVKCDCGSCKVTVPGRVTINSDVLMLGVMLGLHPHFNGDLICVLGENTDEPDKDRVDGLHH